MDNLIIRRILVAQWDADYIVDTCWVLLSLQLDSTTSASFRRSIPYILLYDIEIVIFPVYLISLNK